MFITRFNSKSFVFNNFFLSGRALFCTASNEANKSTRPQNYILYSKNIPFSCAKHGPFFQDNFELRNPFSEDYPLQRYLKRHLPLQIYNDISEDLHRFGERIVTEIYKLGWECEQHLPHLTTYNAWGKRVDELWTCDSWKQQRKVSAEEGIVAIGYERKFHEWSRLYQISKLYLYSPHSGLFSCPLAMTDGAAKTIEGTGLQNPIYAETYKNLTTRDPQKFWTSGQWMTERKGGSDVAGGTETVAVPENDVYRLYGYKWFSSATDADMALTLARVMTENGCVTEGTNGLTLFYVETKDKLGNLNNIQIVKLKSKLGTRQVPTAELLLNGAIAYKMSEEGQGVAGISNMLTLTRIHNAVASVAAMRNMLRMSRDFSQRRYAFGKKIGDFPVHMQTLARMEIEVRGSLLFLLKVVLLLGKVECGTATDEDILLLRIMTPVLKLYTAKQAVQVISEGLETFGGQGYIEETGLPVMLRDAQVLPIWEGTTNILSLDVLRSISKTNGEVLKAFMCNIQTILGLAKHREILSKSCTLVENSASTILNFAEKYPDQLTSAARDFSFSIARTYIGALLLENASSLDSTDVITAQRWCELQDLCPLSSQNYLSCYNKEGNQNDYKIVMEGYNAKV